MIPGLDNSNELEKKRIEIRERMNANLNNKRKAQILRDISKSITKK